MNKLYILTFIIVLLNSCDSWSKEDINEFTDKCMSQNKSEAYCSCVLDKVQSEFTTFKEMNSDENQEKMANILTNVDCFEKQSEEKERGNK